MYQPRSHTVSWPERVLALAGVLAVLVMLVSTLIAVLARYFKLAGFEWSYEIAGIAFLWITFLGALVAEIGRENVAFEVLKDALGAPLRNSLDRLATVLLGAAGAWLLASGIAMLQRSAFVPTPLLRWPGFAMSAAVPVLGMGLCILAILRLRGWRGDRRLPSGSDT
jgi:TRAP-type C4-dicarboxylate transport system permease small subunit